MRTSLVRWLTATPTEGLATRAATSAAEMKELAALGYAPGTLTLDPSMWFDPRCTCAECTRFP